MASRTPFVIHLPECGTSWRWLTEGFRAWLSKGIISSHGLTDTQCTPSLQTLGAGNTLSSFTVNWTRAGLVVIWALGVSGTDCRLPLKVHSFTSRTNTGLLPAIDIPALRYSIPRSLIRSLMLIHHHFILVQRFSYLNLAPFFFPLAMVSVVLIAIKKRFIKPQCTIIHVETSNGPTSLWTAQRHWDSWVTHLSITACGNLPVFSHLPYSTAYSHYANATGKFLFWKLRFPKTPLQLQYVLN